MILTVVVRRFDVYIRIYVIYVYIYYILLYILTIFGQHMHTFKGRREGSYTTNQGLPNIEPGCS